MSGRDELKAWGSPQPEAIEVPGRGRIYVRKLTVQQAQALALQAKKQSDQTAGFAWLFCHYACDADGVALYDPTKHDDVTEVATFELAPVKWAVEKAQELNGLTAEKKA